MNGIYRFLVRGHLDDRWSEWLGGLSIQRMADGSSVLTGSISDQAALHGVIARIRDMGLPLLAVECVEGCEGFAGSSQPEARGSPQLTGNANEDPTLTDGISTQPTTSEGDTSCD